MSITGKIINVLPLTTGISKLGNPWSKQEYVIETLDRFPKQICFEVMGDNIGKFNIQLGQVLTVDVDLSSREFNGRYYTTVSAWRVTTPQQTQT